MDDWKKVYENMLYNKNDSLDKITTYVYDHIPHKLYKYKAFDELKHWETLLYKGKIFLGSSAHQNDPFDCLMKADMDRVIQSEKFKAAYRKKFGVDIPISRITIEECRELFLGVQEDIKIACFSEVYDSILMWSHYTNNHSGICIEYDTNKFSPKIKSSIFPVLYSRTRLDLTEDLMKASINAGYKALVFKAKEWEYEKEWRIILSNEDFINARRAISAVIVGVRCSEERIKEIKEWATKFNPGVPVYKIYMSDTEYKLFRKRI